MPIHVVEMLEEALKESGRAIAGAKVVILGVAFLENSDDTRNSPSLTLYDELKRRGAEPFLHDPLVREFDRPFTDDLDEILQGADALVLMTKHRQYALLDLMNLAGKMRTLVLIDGRNFFDREKVEKAGFLYRGVGKPR
ncbi:MAG: nucleotide sugar dehydrogenase, partial [Thermoplasmata archaeon]|nr:nucleotide sugar dehydrogenase [Thermoplasmata archaeon]